MPTIHATKYTLKDENKVMLQALLHTHFGEGKICGNFTTTRPDAGCGHVGCISAYNAWLVASQALGKLGRLPTQPNFPMEPYFSELMTPKMADGIYDKVLNDLWTALLFARQNGFSDEAMSPVFTRIAHTLFGPTVDVPTQINTDTEYFNNIHNAQAMKDINDTPAAEPVETPAPKTKRKK